MSENEDERPVYNAISVEFRKCIAAKAIPKRGERVSLLHSAPGNFDHDNGEPMTVVTIGRRSGIEPLAFTLADTRVLVTKLLVSLATNDDEFARKILDDLFPADDDGDFRWPNDFGFGE